MRTVAEAMEFIRTMSTVALGAIDKELLRQAIEILTEGAAAKNVSLVSDDPIAQSLKAANALAALLGVIPGQFGDLEVDLSQSAGTFIDQQQLAAEAAGETGTGEFEFPPLLDQPEDEILLRPIGVPVDFVASREGPREFRRDPKPGESRTRVEAIEPQYFEGDELAPATLDGAIIARLQMRLVAAGLLEKNTYYVGAWDDLTIAAYKSVLGFANQNGFDATKAMNRLIATLPQSVKDARARAEQLKVFQEPPYIKPDMATLAQDVKRYFRQEVGRDPTAGEMAEFAGAMSAAYRADFEAEVAVLRSTSDAANQAPTTGSDLSSAIVARRGLTVAAPVAAGGGGTFQGIDPVARFREAFDRRFKPETERLAALGDVRANVNNVYASLRTMTSLIGGNR